MQESLNSVYLICATVGGAILVVQTILLLVGGHDGAGVDADGADFHGGDFHHGTGADVAHDHDHAHGSDHGHGFLKMLSFKTLVAFVTFFGLTGLATVESEFQPMVGFILALGAGVTAFYIVAFLMTSLSRLQSKGNMNIQNAVGQTAQVYLRVPAAGGGQGKVMVSVQGHKVALKAVTAGMEIPSGVEVRVVGVRSSDTLDVIPAERSPA